MDDRVALLCPACFRPVRAGRRFCASCGGALTLSAAPPPTQTPEHVLEQQAARLERTAAQWSELKSIAWLFGLLLFSSFLLGTVSRFESSPWAGAAVAALDAALVLGFVWARRAQVSPWLGVPRLDLRVALELASISVACAALITGYFALAEELGVPMLRYTDEYREAGWPVWSMFVMVSVMPSVFEELAFRGVIFAGLERVFSRYEALAIQAALFSVLHLLPLVFPTHFVMGLCFGWLRLRTGSVYVGMLAHALWNAAVLWQELPGLPG